MDERFLIIVVALAVDAIVGEPEQLWRRVPHPVTLMGRAVDWLDRRFNDQEAGTAALGLKGTLAVAALVFGAIVVGWIVEAVLALLPLTVVLEALAVAALVAGRSLYDHVAAVGDGLARGGLAGGRDAVARIVGRDPESLDEAGVARAAIESAAENLSDGVVAPVFWYALFGLPGLIVYKAVSTADSMIGHRTPRYEVFGTAAARLDDALNWVPARLTAALIMAAAWATGDDARGAAEAMVADAPRHRSVNAGWPEAAMAGALGLALAGPRRYGADLVDDAWMNRGGRDEATAGDIRRALRVYVAASFIHGGLYGLIAVLV